MFLGYQNGTKGYFILDIKSREIFVSRNVTFYEKLFPYANQIDHVLQENKVYQISDLNYFFEPINYNINNTQTKHVQPNLKFKTSLIFWDVTLEIEELLLFYKINNANLAFT